MTKIAAALVAVFLWSGFAYAVPQCENIEAVRAEVAKFSYPAELHGMNATESAIFLHLFKSDHPDSKLVGETVAIIIAREKPSVIVITFIEGCAYQMQPMEKSYFLKLVGAKNI